jgi:peptidyl-prolyl cis-trans isomerase C
VKIKGDKCMYKKIVVPIMLLLFVLQANNLLFANENAEAKTEVKTEVTAEKETKAESDIAVVAEIEAKAAEASTEAVAETESKAEASTEAVAETESKAETSTEAVAETEAKVEAGTEAVAEIEAKAVEASTEAVAETEAMAIAETEAKTEESTKAASEKEVKAQESTAAVAETEVKAEEGTEAVAETENDVIATVNGERIIRKDFDRRMNVIKRMNKDVTRSVQIQVVNQLAKKVLLKQFVEGQNIDVNDEEVQGELEKIKYFLESNPNSNEKSMKEILEIQGSNISELKDEVRRTLALSKYLDERVSDDEKRSYFEENKSAFNDEKVKASHVLIDTTKLKTDAELEKVRQKIEEVKNEIDNGADFAEMAKKYSTCPSAENGGDIGFFQRKGSIVEEFAKVAFSMEVGEVSEPVKSQFGYHIIKVTDKEEGKDVSYEDVADMVDFVYMQIQTENILKGLYEKAEIEITL